MPARRPRTRTRRWSARRRCGHQRNLKLTVGWQHIEGQPDRAMAVLQFQVFYF